MRLVVCNADNGLIACCSSASSSYLKSTTLSSAARDAVDQSPGISLTKVDKIPLSMKQIEIPVTICLKTRPLMGIFRAQNLDSKANEVYPSVPA